MKNISTKIRDNKASLVTSKSKSKSWNIFHELYNEISSRLKHFWEPPLQEVHPEYIKLWKVRIRMEKNTSRLFEILNEELSRVKSLSHDEFLNEFGSTIKDEDYNWNDSYYENLELSERYDPRDY